MDGQGEEVLPFLDALGGGHGAQHHGFAKGGQHRAICLAGNTAGFLSEGLSAPLQAYSFSIEHRFSFLNPQSHIALRGLQCRAYRPGPVWGLLCPLAPSPDCEGNRMVKGAAFRAAPPRNPYLRRPSFWISEL